MKFELNLNDKIADVQPYLISYPEIIEKAKEQYKEVLSREVFDYYTMSISEFLQLQEKIMPQKILDILSNRNTTIKTYLQIVNMFEEKSKEFQSFIESTTIKPTHREVVAQVNLLDTTAEESMLCFVRDYFNHPNFEMAQSITLYEYCIARKAHFNSQMFQRKIYEHNDTIL